MDSLTRIMSYDKTKSNQENCNCRECVPVKNTELKNQVAEYPKLSEEEIEQIISERYSNKDEKTKIFIRKALRKHGDKYDYFNTVYLSFKKKTEIICRKHNTYKQPPVSHLNSSGCKLCANENMKNFVDYSKSSKREKMNTKKFILRSKKIFGNFYNYSKTKYARMKDEIIIICPKHGEFKQIAHNHLNGNGCSECAIEKAKMRNLEKRINDFIQKSKYKYHDLYDYKFVKETYINQHSKVKIICNKCGLIFKITPSAHIQGEGCSFCNFSKGEIVIKSYLENNNIEFIQQYKFEECKDKRPLPFDFYIQQYNLCIEYDGLGHFQKVDYYGKCTNDKLQKNFKYVQKHDKIKTEYCKNNNINLLRISYKENIEDKLNNYFKINSKKYNALSIFDL